MSFAGEVGTCRLETAGLVCACAASLGFYEDWPATLLRNALSRTGLEIPASAAKVLIDDACELAARPNATSQAALLACAYAKRIFEVGGGIRVVEQVLAAEVLLSGTYDARTREACMRILCSLELPPRVLYDAEREISFSLSAQLSRARNLEAVESPRKDESARRARARWLKIGGATVLGGMALGISGGLLAPALIPALGTLGLSGAAGVSSASATMAVGSLFGVAGAGIGASAVANRTGDVKEFVFEKCTCLPVGNVGDQQMKGKLLGSQGHGIVSPDQRYFDVRVAVGQTDDTCDRGYPSIDSGMLVWEFTTSQTIPMVIPAGIRFGVTFTPAQGDMLAEPLPTSDQNRSLRRLNWVYPEEELDAGGMDKHKNGKLNRHTGALTVLGKGIYVLRWRLLPGSLAVDIQYRFAFLPPGVDPPVFIMNERDQEDVNAGVGPDAMSRPRSLSVVIFVPGFLQKGANPEAPGVIVDQFSVPKGAVAAIQAYDIESFGLRWETKLLSNLGQVMSNVVGRFAVRVAAQEGARILAPALVGALALPLSLVMAIRTAIDNTWATSMSRARSATSLLKESLPEFGHRPITLAGYSIGAAVIFWTLEELAKQNQVGVIHDVYIIGAPISCDRSRWEAVRKVVSGRFVNGFWPEDWFLEVAQRSTSFSSDAIASIAGTSPMRLTGGSVENVDITDICKQLGVGTHANFATYATHIFAVLGLGNGNQRRQWPSSFDSADAENPASSPAPACPAGQIWPVDERCENDQDWQNKWISAQAGPLELPEHVGPPDGRSRVRAGRCPRSNSDRSSSSPRHVEDDDDNDVVVFTNRNRRSVQSEPAPVVRF